MRVRLVSAFFIAWSISSIAAVQKCGPWVAALGSAKGRAVIVMGVSGTGKSTVGRAVAEELGWEFLDADDFHLTENKAKMSKGIPITDTERTTWLEELRRQIDLRTEAGKNIVLACSALKLTYRDKLGAARLHVRLVYLYGERDLLFERINQRTDHFFPASLLDSQLATLEPPTDAEALPLDVALPHEQLKLAVLQDLVRRQTLTR